jgi:hypothetical protein
MIANPEYKGKWRAPLIDNPNYQGKWSPRKIQNPDFFEDNNPFARLTPIVRKYLRYFIFYFNKLILGRCWYGIVVNEQ